jgi:hypothetical protein
MGDIRPALAYLLACSDVSLESFRISRMNQAANLRKQVRALVDEWVEAEIDAGVSRWMLECRRTDAVFPALELNYPWQNQSLEHVTISFRPGSVEASAIAAHQKRLSTDLGEIEDIGTCLLMADRTLMPGQYKTARHAHTKRLRKLYAKPIARRRLTSALEEGGTVAMPVRSSLGGQQKLEFEESLVSGVTADQTPGAGVSHAPVEGCVSVPDKALHHASCDHAEARGCELTQ